MLEQWLQSSSAGWWVQSQSISQSHASCSLLAAGTPTCSKAPHGATHAGSRLLVPEAGATWPGKNLHTTKKGRKWLNTWEMLTEYHLKDPGKIDFAIFFGGTHLLIFPDFGGFNMTLKEAGGEASCRKKWGLLPYGFVTNYRYCIPYLGGMNIRNPQAILIFTNSPVSFVCLTHDQLDQCLASCGRHIQCITTVDLH